MKCFIFVKAFSFGRQFFFWNGGALDGHRDSWQVHMIQGNISAHISASFIAGSCNFRFVWRKNLVGIRQVLGVCSKKSP